MPVWGPIFKALSPGDDALGMMRIANLTDYIKTLQQK